MARAGSGVAERPLLRKRLWTSAIFVTTGTNGAPFDRLIRGVEQLDTDERIVVQRGPSGLRPANAALVDYVSFDRLVNLARKARVVVSHGGVGSIFIALTHGKRPLVVPRLKRFGEVVDDHQLLLARRLAHEGLITSLRTTSTWLRARAVA